MPAAGAGGRYHRVIAHFHHVNLGILPGQLDDEASWLVDVLGYVRLDPGPRLAGLANWFEAEDGSQVHLSEDPDHRAAAKAHVAVAVDDGPAIRRHLDERSVEYSVFDNGGLTVLFCSDPAGNRWELRLPNGLGD